LPANVTQAVAFVASWPGSALGSRPELRGQGARLRHWAPVVAAGGASGVALLLCLPAAAFDRAVPFLLTLGSLALLAQPLLTAKRGLGAARTRRAVLASGLFIVSVYDGYFGAGAGVMTLALLLVAAERDLLRANALKNALLGIADVLAAIGFALFGPVHWLAAAPLAAGLLAGSSVGPSLTRRVPGSVLRVLVALTGLGFAVRLWVAPIV
jgi:uncharacterized membrane protein YfcA